MCMYVYVFIDLFLIYLFTCFVKMFIHIIIIVSIQQIFIISNQPPTRTFQLNTTSYDIVVLLTACQLSTALYDMSVTSLDLILQHTIWV